MEALAPRNFDTKFLQPCITSNTPHTAHTLDARLRRGDSTPQARDWIILINENMIRYIVFDPTQHDPKILQRETRIVVFYQTLGSTSANMTIAKRGAYMIYKPGAAPTLSKTAKL